MNKFTAREAIKESENSEKRAKKASEQRVYNKLKYIYGFIKNTAANDKISDRSCDIFLDTNELSRKEIKEIVRDIEDAGYTINLVQFDSRLTKGEKYNISWAEVPVNESET